MKTTNFEISKKLKEAGYVGKTDLETLLMALPKSIGINRGVNQELRIWFSCDELFGFEADTYIGYQNGDGFIAELTLQQNKNESLADTAGRLLIKLHEAGIIKFNK